ncbi:MAG: translation initiation factor IF-2 subunit gamma [Candidatus Nanopusillus sp.]
MDDIIYPDLSIILLGHVDHGKTTLAKSLTGKWLSKHSEEIKRGLTIKLGYADFTIYKCNEHGYFTEKTCPICNKENKPIRKISIVDAPGHESLLMVMLTGAAIVDAAILVIAANEPVPQPQTLEHLVSFKYLENKPLIIVQNKIDLVTKEEAMKNYQEILNLLDKLNIDKNKVKIIPISAINNININYLLEELVNLPKPKKDENSDPIFLISRSFDVNKPGTDIEKLIGGVLGGSLLKGKLKLNDDIEIKPGLFINNKWIPIKTKIVSLKQGNYDVEEILPRGTAGIGTTLDPSVTKDDTLAGQIVGYANKLPPQYDEIKVKYEVIKELFNENEKIQRGETIIVGVYNIISDGIVKNIEKENIITIKLNKPILGYKDDKVIILKNINKRWKIFAIGKLL